MDAHHLVVTELNPKIQDFRPGDTVRVSIRVREGDRQRIQVFEGVVTSLPYPKAAEPLRRGSWRAYNTSLSGQD